MSPEKLLFILNISVQIVLIIEIRQIFSFPGQFIINMFLRGNFFFFFGRTILARARKGHDISNFSKLMCRTPLIA